MTRKRPQSLRSGQKVWLDHACIFCGACRVPSSLSLPLSLFLSLTVTYVAKQNKTKGETKRSNKGKEQTKAKGKNYAPGSTTRARLVFAAPFRLEPSPSIVESDSSLEPARVESSLTRLNSARPESRASSSRLGSTRV